MGDFEETPFAVNEVEENAEEGKELQPFTLEDALEDEANMEVCLFCSHRNDCPIVVYVNKLSMKRDEKTAEEDFGCSIFKSEEQVEEV